LTTEVHKGKRFDQYHFLGADSSTGKYRPAASFVPLPTMLCRQFIYNPKANIVSCAFVFRARIAQTNDQFHKHQLPTISQAYREIVRQSGLHDLLLCYLKSIGDTIKFKTALGIKDHKCGPRVAVTRLTNST